MMYHRLHLNCVVLFSLALAGCTHHMPGTHSPGNSTKISADQLIDSLRHYRSYVLTMDSRHLADMFTEDAEISHSGGKPVSGRDEILKFLNSFSEYHVLSYEISGDDISAQGEDATQSGHYTQTVKTPDSNEVTVKGTFTALWHLQPDGQVKIFRMHTEPSD